MGKEASITLKRTRHSPPSLFNKMQREKYGARNAQQSRGSSKTWSLTCWLVCVFRKKRQQKVKNSGVFFYHSRMYQTSAWRRTFDAGLRRCFLRSCLELWLQVSMFFVRRRNSPFHLWVSSGILALSFSLEFSLFPSSHFSSLWYSYHETIRQYSGSTGYTGLISKMAAWCYLGDARYPWYVWFVVYFKVTWGRGLGFWKCWYDIGSSRKNAGTLKGEITASSVKRTLLNIRLPSA